MKLLKFVVQDSQSRTILNNFCIQIAGAIGRYNNAMAALAWVQYYIRPSHILMGEKTGQFCSMYVLVFCVFSARNAIFAV